MIVWDGELVQFPADFNAAGDRLCHIDSETEWALNWTIDARKG
jgi:hypothetical protein